MSEASSGGKRVVTENDGQPLFIDDVLVLGHRHTPGLLVQPLLPPVGVAALQGGRHTIVLPEATIKISKKKCPALQILPHEERMQHDEVDLLVDPQIASKETFLALPLTNFTCLDGVATVSTAGRKTVSASPSFTRYT